MKKLMIVLALIAIGFAGCHKTPQIVTIQKSYTGVIDEKCLVKISANFPSFGDTTYYWKVANENINDNARVELEVSKDSTQFTWVNVPDIDKATSGWVNFLHTQYPGQSKDYNYWLMWQYKIWIISVDTI